MFKIDCSKRSVKSNRGVSQLLAVGPKELSQPRAASVVQLLARSIMTACAALQAATLKIREKTEKDEVDYLSALEMEAQVANIAGR